MDSQPFNVLSLCTGIGGLDIGVELALPDARVVCMVEGEAFAVECMASAYEALGMACPPCWSDVRTFDGKPWRGVVDCLTAGYPCQPFSNAGKRLGEDDPRHLWPDIARIIGETRPPWVFLENVAAHLRMGFEAVRHELQEMGYSIAAGVFKAGEVGSANRHRTRLFALAHCEGCDCNPRHRMEKGQNGRSQVQPGGLDGVSVAGEWRPGDSWWHAEPEDDLLVDGQPLVTHKLHTLGNGVVPLQAAYAFTALLACHCDDEG